MGASVVVVVAASAEVDEGVAALLDEHAANTTTAIAESTVICLREDCIAIFWQNKIAMLSSLLMPRIYLNNHQCVKGLKMSIRHSFESKKCILGLVSVGCFGLAGLGIYGSANAVAITACGDSGTVTTDGASCSMAPGEVIGYIVRGADGGQSDTGAAGGLGGVVQGTFANETGSTLTISIRIGQDGADGSSYGGGGGGFSALQIGTGWDIADAIAIAGGGGGGGTYSDDGGGGGNDAANASGGGNGGDECCDGGYAGGSASSGGSGGVGSPDPSNAGGAGGDVGASGEVTTRVDDTTGNGGDGGDGYMDGAHGGAAEDWGGGGGAGYAGGGGGGGYDSDEGGAGGGGSSYFTGDAVGGDPTSLVGAQVIFTREANLPSTTTTVEITDDTLVKTGAQHSKGSLVVALLALGLGCTALVARRRTL